jgi:hypothetical protein
MANVVFVSGLALLFTLLLAWGFKALPKEGRQILAALPVAKEGADHWRGVNLTYYGLLNANAYTAAVAIMIILMGAIGAPLEATLMWAILLLALCMPASRLVAKLVERKSYTFTIGGASFVGILAAPWAIELINAVHGDGMNPHIPVMPAMAALAIAYSFGEGMGRLACISFGCCYGKPLSQSHPLIQKVFENCSFTFFGKTKKIAYASNLEGERVVPVQAVTSTLYIGIGLLGIVLYLSSHHLAAFILSVATTQGWRSVSEVLRADYRGEGKISAYQIMGALAIFYAVGLSLVFPSTPDLAADVSAGIKSLWNPGVILFLQVLWVACFLYTGRSMITGSTISFYVHKDRI